MAPPRTRVIWAARRGRYPRIKSLRALAESFRIRSSHRMGTKRLDKISDYARHGFDLRIVCKACGRVSVIDARALTASCISASLSRNMPVIERRLRCQSCRGRVVSCGPIERR